MRLSGLLRVAVAAVCFGFLGIFSRLAYEHGANVAGVVSARAMIVLPLIAVIALRARDEHRRRRIETRPAARLIVPMALLGVMNSVTYFVAVDRMSPALVTLVIYVYPAVTVIGSRLLGWTRLSPFAVVATGMTLAGVAITVGLPQGSIDPLATGLALVNGCGYAVFLLLAQRALRDTDSLTLYAAVAGPAALILLVGSFVVADPAFATDAVGLASLLCAGVVSTVLATVLQFTGIQRLGSAPTAVVASLEIITVVTASALVFAEPLGTDLVVGGLLIVLGAVAAPLAISPVEKLEPASEAR